MVEKFIIEKTGSKLGVEKSGVEMSFNLLIRTPIKVLKSGSLFNLPDEFAVLNGVK